MATLTRPAPCRATPWRWRRDWRRSRCSSASRDGSAWRRAAPSSSGCWDRCWRRRVFPCTWCASARSSGCRCTRRGHRARLSPCRNASARALPRCFMRCSSAASTCHRPATRPASCPSRTAVPISRASRRRCARRWRLSHEGGARLPAHCAAAGGGVGSAGRLVDPRSARAGGAESARGARRVCRAGGGRAGTARCRSERAARAAAAAADRGRRRARGARAAGRGGAAHRGAPPLQPVRLGGRVLSAGARGLHRGDRARAARGGAGAGGAGELPRARVSPVQDTARESAAVARDHDAAHTVGGAVAHAHRSHAGGPCPHGGDGHADPRERAPGARPGRVQVRAAGAGRGGGARGGAPGGARAPGAHPYLLRHRAGTVRGERSAGARCGGAQPPGERARRGDAARRRQHRPQRPRAQRRGGAVGARQRRGLSPRGRRAPVREIHAPASAWPGQPVRYRPRALHRASPDAPRAGARERAQRGRGPGRAFRAHLAGGAGAALMSAPSGTRVLVVEDDPHLAAGVMENLRAEGYEVSTAGDGEQALEWLRERGCALIVLDVMLPGIDGFGVCRTLREQGNNTPVLFLTARGDPVDRVRGLESGGDDYLAKPFHLQEFLLRVRAILRRWDWYRNASATPAGAVLQFAGNEVDFRAFRARSWNGIAQELTEKEAMILKVLAEHPGEIVSREDLLEKVWGYDVFPSTRTVDNFILRLRKRFERDPANPRHFLTVWGVGYRFLTEGEP